MQSVLLCVRKALISFSSFKLSEQHQKIEFETLISRHVISCSVFVLVKKKTEIVHSNGNHTAKNLSRRQKAN